MLERLIKYFQGVAFSEQQRNFILGHGSVAAAVVLMAGISVFCLITALAMHVVSTQVVTGHLESLQLNAGPTLIKNTYQFTIRESSGLYKISGLGEADQTLLASEKRGALAVFTVPVVKSKKSKNLPVAVSTLKIGSTTYLDNLGDAIIRRGRIMVLMFAFILAVGAVVAGRKAMVIYKTCTPECWDHKLDPLLVWAAKFSPLLAEIEKKSIGMASERPATEVPKYALAVELLIRSGKDINIQNAEGKTPLHIAAAAGHVEAVGLLLNAGIKTDIQDAKGMTALMVAAEKGYTGIVTKLLAAKTNLLLMSTDGENALTIARKNKKNVAIVEMLRRATEKAEVAEKARLEAEAKAAAEAAAAEAAAKTDETKN
jgi:hypothetical protein